jgi:hypothetical protein
MQESILRDARKEKVPPKQFLPYTLTILHFRGQLKYLWGIPDIAVFSFMVKKIQNMRIFAS